MRIKHIKQPKAEEIKAYREKLKAKQTDLAQWTHVSVRTWQNWEGGSIPMPLATWELLQYRFDDYRKRMARRPNTEKLPPLKQSAYGDWTE